MCGSISVLQVHHIFSRKTKGLFLDVANGVVLCRKCHCKVSFSDTARETLRRSLHPDVYERLYEQSKILGVFDDWKNIVWLEEQIQYLKT